jgi:hypothetical protein
MSVRIRRHWAAAYYGRLKPLQLMIFPRHNDDVSRSTTHNITTGGKRQTVVTTYDNPTAVESGSNSGVGSTTAEAIR